MSDDKWISVILGILGLGLSVTVTLIGIIFSWLKSRIDRNEEKVMDEIRGLEAKILERLRTLGHEDRDIRGSVEGLKNLFIEHIGQRKHKGD